MLTVTRNNCEICRVLGRHRSAPVLTLTEPATARFDRTPALEQLRSGDVDQAVSMLRDHGRVVTGSKRRAVRGAMVEQWWQHRTSGPRR
jgi:hypothetical protein